MALRTTVQEILRRSRNNTLQPFTMESGSLQVRRKFNDVLHHILVLYELWSATDFPRDTEQIVPVFACLLFSAGIEFKNNIGSGNDLVETLGGDMVDCELLKESSSTERAARQAILQAAKSPVAQDFRSEVLRCRRDPQASVPWQCRDRGVCESYTDKALRRQARDFLRTDAVKSVADLIV